MTKNLMNEAKINSSDAPEAILALSNEINEFKEQLISGQALNLENVHFLLNNFFNRLKNKNLLTIEEKQTFITYLNTQGYLSSNEQKAELSAGDKAILANLNSQIKDKSAFIDSLNTSIVENQQKLIDEEASMVFLEKNNISSISQEEEHINSYDLGEELSVIFDLNKQIPEKYQIQNELKLYLNPDSIINKVRVGASSSPASIKALQELVSNYKNKQNILSDLMALNNYASTLATLEESSLEAQSRLNQKQLSLDMLVSAINEAKKDVQKTEKDLKQLLNEKTKLVGDDENGNKDIGLNDISNGIKDSCIELLSVISQAPEAVQEIVYKLFGANAQTKIPALVNTYSAIEQEIEKGLTQTAELEESLLDFISSLAFKQKRLAVEEKTLSNDFNTSLNSTLNLANDWLKNTKENYTLFCSNAFDSSVDDYFDEKLTKNLNIFETPNFDNLISQLQNTKEEMKNSAPTLKKSLSM